MTTFQIIIRKIGIHFSKPIWSFIRNCVFWLFHLNKISEARIEKASLIKMDIVDTMRMFIWREDTFGDWTPWIITLCANEVDDKFQDDCDGAAALAKWWFKQHGVDAEILNLYSDKEGHTVCVTKDRTKMVTNERVVSLNPTCWEKEVMEYFGNKYEVII